MSEGRGALDYRGAGVDIDAADDAKARIKRLVESTFTAGARGRFGGFGGMFRMPPEAKRPVLVASTDSVGTKIKVAIEAGRHDSIGHDLVNHCVNDVLVQGALPMFFLDYVAFGVIEPAVVEAVVAGVAAGCRENECSLIGGETAELPGVYTPPDYDLAGFVVGWVEEDAVLGPERVRDGDALIGLASSGLHTNGYSLARRIVADRMRLGPIDPFPGESESTADALLRVHRSYLPALRPVLGTIHAMAHVTGGGLAGKLAGPRLRQVGPAQNRPQQPVDRARRANEQLLQVARRADPQREQAGQKSSAGQQNGRGRDLGRGVRAWRLGRVIRGRGQVILN